MSDAQKDLWVQRVLQPPKEMFEAPRGGGSKAPEKEQIKPERIKAMISDADQAASAMLDRYREAKAGANTGLGGNIEDPGPKVEKAASSLHKGVAEANKHLKSGDVATAAKLAKALSAEASRANQLVTDFAVALDHGATTNRAQAVGTPWGTIAVKYEESTKATPFIMPLSKTLEIDKTAATHYQATVTSYDDGAKPIADFIKAPDKAAAEISKFASEKAVNWAEHSDTASLVTKFSKVYEKTLNTLLHHAKGELDVALTLLDAGDLKAQAAAVRKQAEEVEKGIDLLLEALKGGAKLAVLGPEEAFGVAADVVGGLIHAFHGNQLAERADKLEEEAAKLGRDALNKACSNASQMISDVQDQLDELEPLIGSSSHSAERKTRRATKQFDDDCAKSGGKCKFDFKAVKHAQKLARIAAGAADEWQRVWLGAEALLDLLKKELDATGYLAFNGETLGKIKTDIDQHMSGCIAAQHASRQRIHDLETLFNKAMSALQEARQPPKDEDDDT